MNAERVSGFFWLAVGLITLYGSFHLGLGTFREPASGFFPLLAGCVICFLAIIVLLQSFRRREEAWAKLSTLWAEVDWHRPLIIVFLIVGFILVLEWLGFILSGFLFLFILFKWEGKMSWRKAIMIPLITLIFTYLIFDVFLKANLPKGILGD